MSINVTVTGNPVSINRGKMVTCSDSDRARGEFERRRLMRLEQVRQQSKDIAEDVRNKVRKEKRKQTKMIEDEGKETLRRWQNRKLLELQNQYREALQEIGSGHKAAEKENEEAEIEVCRKECEEQAALRRGREALAHLQAEKNRDSFQKVIPVQRKKLVRDIENNRASLVADIKRHTPKKEIKKPPITVPKVVVDKAAGEKKDHRPQQRHFKDKKEIERGRKYSSFEQVKKEPSLKKSKKRSEHVKKDRPGLVPVKSDVKHVKKKRKKGGASANINITVPDDDSGSESDSETSESSESSDDYQESDEDEGGEEEEDEEGLELVENSEESVGFGVGSDDSGKPRSPLDQGRGLGTAQTVEKSGLYSDTSKKLTKESAQTVRKSGLYSDTSKNFSKESGIQKQSVDQGISSSYTRLGSYLKDLDSPPVPPLDTRISERIKQRTLIPPEPPFSQPTSYIRETDRCPKQCICGRPVDDISKTLKSKSVQVEEVVKKPPTTGSRTKSNSQRMSQEIPSLPSVKLKPSSVCSNLCQGSSKVQFYDHMNKITTEREIPISSYVEKYPDEDSLEVVTDPVSEMELREKAAQRQREAQMRGKKALEQEKIQKDYEEMLKRLPLLQKKERIAQISKDKPEYHMGEERLREVERRRQNEMDNAYVRAFGSNIKPAVVTIPSKQPETVVKDGSVQSLDMAEWDVDEEPKIFTAAEVQKIVKAFTGRNPNERRAKLKELLESLKLQKEELIEEIQKIPADESINELINDLRTVESGEKVKGKKEKETEEKRRGKKVRERRKAPESKRRKMRDEDVDSAAESVSSSSSSSSFELKKREKALSKRQASEKAQVLIRQNSSTQTSPAIEQQVPHKPPVCEKYHVPCDCKSPDELCQILIKLDKKTKPEVVVRNKEQSLKEGVELKSVGVGTETTPAYSRRQPTSKDRSKEKWREQFSKNSMSTSSTSYQSPPDFKKFINSINGNFPSRDPQKPHTNVSYSFKTEQITINPDLVPYIERLLSMSRASVDNLNTSSTSSFTTPSQSVVEIESNNPNAYFQNLIQNFYIKANEMARNLSYSPDVPHNTSASTTTSTSQPKNTVPDNSSSMESRESLLKQYACITESCSKRIANLAMMIKQLRNEKDQMLKGDTNCICEDDREGMAASLYLDLPEDGSSGTASLDEEEMFKRIMEIDSKLTERLKETDTILKEVDLTDVTQKNEKRVDPIAMTRKLLDPDSTNIEILNRIQRLRETEVPPEESPTGFVPFLSDIPKLPKLEPISSSNNKKPPPSKGLITAKKLNENIAFVPHELSTIAEADSVVSPRIESPPKQSDLKCVCPTNSSESDKRTPSSKKDSPSSKSNDSIEAMLRSIGMEWAIPTLHKTQEALALNSSSSSSPASCKPRCEAKQRKLASHSLSSSSASGLSDLSGFSALGNQQQRTSTPLTSSKSTSKSKEQEESLKFTDGCSISSVKRDSDTSGLS